MHHDNTVWHTQIITFMAGAEAEQLLLESAPQRGDGDDRYPD